MTSPHVNLQAVSKKLKGLEWYSMGLGFLWAWNQTLWTDISMTTTMARFDTRLAWAVWQAATAAAFLLGAAVCRRRHVGGRPWELVAATVAAVFGSIPVGFALLANIDAGVLVAGALAVGLANAWLLLLWVRSLAQSNIARLESVVPSNGFTYILCIVLASLFEGVARWALAVGFVVGSNVLLACRQARVPGRQADEIPRASERLGRTVAVSALLFLFVGLLTMFGEAVSGSATWVPHAVDVPLVQDVPLVVGALFSIAFCLFSLSHAVRVDMAGVFRWMAPLVAAGSLCVTWDAPWATTVGLSLLSVCEVGSQICIVVYSIEMALIGGRSPLSLAGVIYGGYYAGTALGALLMNFGTASGLDTKLALEATLVAFLLTTVLVPVRYPRSRLYGGVGAQDAGPASLEGTCDAIAGVYGLTARERDILAYLAQGHTRAHIRDELVVSLSTISFHVKNIYRKLDVHSKEELLQFVLRYERR